MDLKGLIKNCKKGLSGLFGAECVLLAYMDITGILMIFVWDYLHYPETMVLLRVGMVAYIFIAKYVYEIIPNKWVTAARVFMIMLTLITWYPETYDFCRIFPYLDHIFAQADQVLFGCQPSLEFVKAVNSTFWYEAFNLGYYSYYYLMVIMVLYYFFFKFSDFGKAVYIFFGAFFTYYLIYDLLPVAGPQYYFQAIGVEAAEKGIFENMYHYFQLHYDMLPTETRGIFSALVKNAQEVGECPTAAFPSSHVGMSTVTMLLMYRANRTVFWVMFPLYVLLCCATVYIQAHYLVDSIAGFITALLFFYIGNKSYAPLKKKLNWEM